MKMFLATLLISGSAFAGTYMEHDYAGALKNIDISNACVTETTVRTINPQKSCVEYKAVKTSDGDGGYFTDYVCVKTAKQNIEYSRTYNKSVCAEYGQVGGVGDAGHLECIRSETKQMFLPQTIKVRVITNNGDTDNWPGQTKSFTFPSCE